MTSSTNEYDEVPYPSLAFLQTHPDRLAVIATLCGMNPPNVERCRVLELACGDGSNLIPMAYGFPGSEFVGVDLAMKPVRAAQEMIQELTLENIRIEQKDLLDIGAEFGEFDYIIAHGVFAWVPEHVQEKILAICSASLSPDGVAFISYNTQPAGHVRQILREMVLFHESRTGRQTNRVDSGREVLEKILNATDGRSPWRALFADEFRLAFQKDPGVVYHDDLAENFSPTSFADFVARADRHGLQFLGEAQVADVVEVEGGPGPQDALRELAHGDNVAYQQYLDFAKFRRFRQSLLCRAGVTVRREGAPEHVSKLLVASPMRVSKQLPDGALEFTNGRGAGTLTTNNPALIAMLRRLESIWPRAEQFTGLVSQVQSLNSDPEKREAVSGLAKAVLQLGANSMIDLRTCHWRLAEGVSEKPEASRLARKMASENGTATTLLHTRMQIEDEMGKHFLQLLDGTRDQRTLVNALAEGAPNVPREEMLKRVDASLMHFNRAGLLLA